MAARLILLGGQRNIPFLVRQGVCVRGFAVTSSNKAALTVEQRDEIERRFEIHYQSLKEEKADIKKWKRFSFFAVIPFLAVLVLYIAVIDHEPNVRVKFKPYDHLRTYRKPLPWRDGKGPMLFNKKMIATKDGYVEPPPPSH